MPASPLRVAPNRRIAGVPPLRCLSRAQLLLTAVEQAEATSDRHVRSAGQRLRRLIEGDSPADW